MSAILLGQKRDKIFDINEKEDSIKDNSKVKEQIIEGKNRTYVITKTLGKGTFGKVKLAHNINNTKEKYACKILLKSNIKDEDDYIRCKREMEILKRMHHVNVVRIYEIISTNTTYFIIMDYCAKGELFNYIVEQQHLSEEKSAFFYYQIINGIEYIHNKGVCHRDLKPENLLLTEKMKLKIIDFGLSNFFTGNLLETPCGSPCYASPEMVMGKKYNGFDIDIWSSGIILYAMLCGYLPFEEMENDEYNEVLFKNIVECNVDYDNEFISPITKDLLTKILVKDPKKRIKIEEIKQHSFYLLGELLFKQTFENYGDFKDYDLFVIEDKNNLFNNDSFIKDNDKNKNTNKDIKENKIENSMKRSKDINNKNNDENNKKMDNNEKNKKMDNNEKNKNINNDINLNIKNKNKEKEKEKENIQSIQSIQNSDNNNNKNKTKNIRDEILYNSEKIKKNQNCNRVENIKNKEQILNRINQIIPNKNNDNNNKDNKYNKDNKNIKKEKSKENNKLRISSESRNKSKDKKENKNSIKSDKITILKEPKSKNNKKESSKQLSSFNYNKIHLLTSDNLNIKIDKNKQQKISKDFSSQEDYNIKIVNKKSNEINFNSEYLKTEIYPKNTINKNNKDLYQSKLLNKKLLIENRITFNNILKSLQNRNNFKYKTPNRYVINKNKINIKKNVLSNSINKAKNKYCSHSPCLRNFEKINNNINLHIENNINFPRQTKIPLTNHNNNYYLLNDKITKYFNNNNYFKNYFKNNTLKQNKKFLDKENNNKIIKRHSNNIINYGKNNKDLNIVNNKFYVQTISNGKINIEKELSKHSLNKKNLKSFEYYLSSNNSKKKHLKIETKIINNNNFKDNNFNKISKKSFNNLKEENLYLNKNKINNTKPVLVHSNHSRTNTEIIDKKAKNNLKNRINLISSKNTKNYKIKKNDFHNLFSHKLHYLNNKDNDNNIIINFNILKPNIFFDQQKSSKNATIKKVNNKGVTPKIERISTENNFCSTMRNISINKNYKNIDTNQIKKSKEINKIIKSIQELQKFHGNFNNTKKKMNAEFFKAKKD